ncbi:MAG: Trk system potassium transporter TrkA [Methanosarcinaceae archaeon]|nr:Trk system potassium transporter TrkA [Methanosarcinaceae archaeon]
MRIIIIGGGEVGYHIAAVMSAENHIYVVDNSPERLSRIKDLDVQSILGNGSSPILLKEILPADVLVAATNNDEVNIISCLNAKNLSENNIQTIARISNTDYVVSAVSSRTDLGVDVTVCPELSLASEIIRLLNLQGAIDSESFAEGRVEMIEFIISEENPYIGKKFKEVRFTDYCIISGILRNNEMIIPGGDDFLSPGDHIIVLCSYADRDSVQKIFGSAKDTKKGNKKTDVVIFGCGTIGLYLAKVLDKDKTVDLKIIEKSNERCLEVVDMLPHSLILNGDATDINLFKEENLGSADVVIALTDSDEKNLLCGLTAKHMGAKKIISRTRRANYIPVFEMVGIDIALSTQKTTVNEVLRLTAGKNVKKIHAISEGAEIFEFVAKGNTKFIGIPIKDFKFPKESIISMIVRNNNPIIPTGDTVIFPGDRVIVFAKVSAYDEVINLFK